VSETKRSIIDPINLHNMNSHSASASSSGSQAKPLAQVRQIAQRVAKHIHGHSASDEAFVVSVYGEWGVGKTHYLRGIETLFAQSLPAPFRQPGVDSALEFKEQDGVPPLVVPVFFSPWMYEKEPHLIIPLLKTIEASLQKVEKRAPNETWQGVDENSTLRGKHGFFKRVSDLFRLKLENTISVDWLSVLKTVAASTGTLGGMPLIDVVLKLLSDKAVELKSQVIGESAESQADGKSAETHMQEQESLYYSFRDRLQQLLNEPILVSDKKSKVCRYVLRFVVLVDDLDRCLPEKAVEMLEAIKLFMNVPGFAFVLAVDDDIVERGIRHRYADYLKEATTDANGFADNQLPISGHEYLEKIVHLPQHLIRWDIAQAATLLQRHCQEFTDNKALRELALRVVPLVPRKLIRLAEALDFQQNSLQAQCEGTELIDQTEKANVLQQAWQPLSALRILIIAQLYPEVYRLLRQGECWQFWWRLFSLRRDGETGVMLYSNCLSLSAPSESRDAAALHSEAGIGPDKQAGKVTQGDGLLALSCDDIRAYVNDTAHHSVRYDKVKEPGNDEEADNGEATIAHKYQGYNFLGKSKQSAREVISFMQTVQRACETRNGWGLLDLWTQEERTEILRQEGAENPRINAVMGCAAAPLNEGIFRALMLSGDIELLNEENWRQLQVVTPGQQSAELPTTETIDNEAEKPEKAVADVEAWIAAILGDRQAFEGYLTQNPRDGEPADAQAYSQLLAAFCGLTVQGRRQLCGAKNSAWRARAAVLLGKRQLDYLLSLVPDDPLIVNVNGKEKPRFEIINDGSEVTDHLTGLTWKRLPEGMRLASDTDGKPKGEVTKVTWEKAKENVKKANANKHSTEAAWDLPSPRQLQSLVNYSVYEPATFAEIFPATPSAGFWTISPDAVDSGHAWLVLFGNGSVSHFLHGNQYCVRLVRGV